MREGSLQGRSVLVADDDALVLAMLARLLRSHGVNVVEVTSGHEVKSKLEAERFHLIISDLGMPDFDGIAVIRYVKERRLLTPVIILAKTGGVPDAVQAMREGAFDFLTKPFHPTSLIDVVKTALRDPTTSKHVGRPSLSNVTGVGTAAVLLGQSPALKSMLEIIQQVGPTDAAVLITGETGSGKEVIARLLHATSSRADQRMITVNCAAIPEHLIESELFGHVKGAFTGAHQGRVGRLREAGQGTVFLDEIGDLPLSMQTRLLRVLQDHLVTPIGSERSYVVNVRFIAATNRDLGVMVHEGKFRHDLFYRLNVVPIHVPPLRERLEDVPSLAMYFLEQAACRLNRSIQLSEKTLAWLQLHSWPGNVRELENLMERMAILDRDGLVDTDDLPTVVRREAYESSVPPVWEFTERGLDLPTAVERFERAMIATAMRRAGNNKSKAAVLLGIGRTTLIDKIRKLGQ
jgi:DNA-binding NtrC family response regulator